MQDRDCQLQDRRADREGAYGARMSEAFGVEAPVFLNRNLKSGLLAVTEVRDPSPELEMSGSLPIEDAFLATLHLTDIPNHTAWEAGRQYPVLTIREGETLIRDLKRDPTVLVAAPHHEFHFYVPRAALDQIADDSEARRIGDLNYRAGVPFDDTIMANLGISLRAAFRLPDQANPMFLDHLLMAAATHLASAYGELRPGSRTRRGGLAPWQVRRATEFLRANLGADVDVAEIAQDCGLSTSHFRRAFRETLELAPHQWILKARVDAAKDKLLDPRLSLDEVARGCGFADQSHFTRVFSRLCGISPGRWRRERGMSEAAGRPH